MEGRRRSETEARPTEAQGKGELLPRDGPRAGLEWHAMQDGYFGGMRME